MYTTCTYLRAQGEIGDPAMSTLQFTPSSLTALSAMPSGSIELALQAMGQLVNFPKESGQTIRTGVTGENQEGLGHIHLAQVSQSPPLEIAYTEIENDNFAVLDIGRDL